MRLHIFVLAAVAALLPSSAVAITTSSTENKISKATPSVSLVPVGVWQKDNSNQRLLRTSKTVEQGGGDDDDEEEDEDEDEDEEEEEIDDEERMLPKMASTSVVRDIKKAETTANTLVRRGAAPSNIKGWLKLPKDLPRDDTRWLQYSKVLEVFKKKHPDKYEQSLLRYAVLNSKKSS
ncbi:hypothetical protein PHYBOEH_002585 [Phytophthora boehmeriae]|uniref:RxLR effector protein n=1 Tax=Phytophthora boehmeriae TaxID=109152 RepID=A0A8T1V5N3_9STRA|nr:hypothetical protein PHYBOEH_002585 [Phytophthora boehmeriae]